MRMALPLRRRVARQRATTGPARAGRLLAAVAALIGGLTLAAPAQAGVGAPGQVGPISPLHGFPVWYDDGMGLRLELCLDGPPLCLAGVPDDALPAEVGPTPADSNFEDEAFWWTAEADMAAGGVDALLVLAQEAAFATAVQDGDQMAFGRVRIRVSGLVDGGTYTVTHPYGTETFTGDEVAGGVINFTDDVGCVPVPAAMQVCDFSLTQFSQVGPPFLRWDPSESAPPAGHIGDPNVPHTVVGSPTGDNEFRITGPGLPVGGLVTEDFAVQGKLAGPDSAFADLRPRSIAFGDQTVGTASTVRTVSVFNGGTIPMTVSSVALGSDNAGEFAIARDACTGATVASGATCTVDVSFVPVGAGAKTAVLFTGDNAAGGFRNVTVTGTGVPAPVVAPPAPQPQPPAPAGQAVESQGAAALSVTTLRAGPRISRRTARRRGITVTFVEPAGASIIRVRVFRVTGTGERRIYTRLFVARGAGRRVIRLNSVNLRRQLRTGRYRIEVTPGTSRTAFGAPVRRLVRIVG